MRLLLKLMRCLVSLVFEFWRFMMMGMFVLNLFVICWVLLKFLGIIRLIFICCGWVGLMVCIIWDDDARRCGFFVKMLL